MEGQEQIHAVRIREALARILASDGFVRSRRLGQYLTWLVDRALNGGAAEITEYTVATEVYQRGDDFDPRIDGTVRVETYRLRRKLQEYYAGAGSGDPVRIIIAKGGYAPQFQIESVSPPASPAPGPRFPFRTAGLAFACALLLGCLNSSVPVWRLTPAGLESLLARSEACIRRSDFLTARSLLQRAARGGAADARVFAALAQADSELGYSRDARDAAASAAAMAPGNLPAGPQLIIETRMRIGSGDWEGAVRAAARLVQQDPANSEGRLWLAQAYARTGKFTASLAILHTLRATPGAAEDARLDRLEALDHASLEDWPAALEWVRSSVRKSKTAAPNLLHARCLLLESGILYTMQRRAEGDHARTAARIESAQLGDLLGVARALRVEGNVLVANARFREGMAAFDHGLDAAAALGDDTELFHLLRGKAFAANELELPGETADAIRQAVGSNLGGSGMAIFRASWLMDRGSLADAALLAEEAVPAARRTEDPQELVDALVTLARARTVAGNTAAARPLVSEAAALVQRYPLPEQKVSLALVQAEMLRRDGDSRTAQRLLAAAGAESHSVTEALRCRVMLVQLALDNGDLDTARVQLRQIHTAFAGISPSAQLVEAALESLRAAKEGDRELAHAMAVNALRSVHDGTPLDFRVLANTAAADWSQPKVGQTIAFGGLSPGPLLPTAQNIHSHQ